MNSLQAASPTFAVNMSLLVIGSMAFDAIETPFGKTDKIIGGAATYISVCASYFTQPINVISIVGHDFPEETMSMLRGRGVDLNGVEIKPDGKTFFWSGKYHNDMNSRDTITTELNVLAEFNPVVPADWKNPEFVLLGNLTPQVQSSVIKQLDKRPKLIAMDTMNFWMDIAMDDLKETLKLVDMLIINEEEARQLSGVHSLVKASKLIREMGPKYLIIKKGEHGALLFHEDQIFSAPGLPLEEVYDPTGAGDTFAGGFMGYLTSKNDISFESMRSAVIYGSAMASYCVEKFGVERLLELNMDRIQERVAQFSSLAVFGV